MSLCRKGIFPYSWFDNADKINYKKLPDKDQFYDELTC